MRRYIGFFALVALMVMVASQALVRGQDKVERRDKKGSVVISGKIVEETAAGVKVRAGGGALAKEETIPSSEILRVTYADLPAKASLELGKLQPAEAARDLPALLKGYEAVQALPEVKTSALTTRRYIDYRVASLRAAVAEGDDQVKAAEKGLADFIAANPDSWEFPHAARQLGHLQADRGEYDGAARTFDALEKSPTVPPEFKAEATAALIDLGFQSKKYDVAQKRVEAVAKDAQ